MKYFSDQNKKGFTAVEMLIVVAIIVILATIALVNYLNPKESAYYGRALSEFKAIAGAMELYASDRNGYPADVNRGMPPGLETYLNQKDWPSAPWPGSVYDWDNWDDPNNPGKKIYQISIRFCPSGGTLSQCNFPKESWAANFGVNSAVYYCVTGGCQAHSSEAHNYPGYCVNCETQPSGN